MGLLYLAVPAFTVWMAVEAVRRGQASSWLWIIIMFPPIGGIVYFFSEYADSRLWSFGTHTRRVTTADLRQAEADVQRLGNAATWLAYASALRARKEHAKAVEAAQKAVERNPKAVDAQYELALALIDAKRTAEAVGPLQQVITHNRSFDSEHALFCLAQAQLAAGDAEAARLSLEEVGGRSSRPEYLYQWAVLEGQAGHREQAAHALQRILTEGELVPRYHQGQVRPWMRKARQGLRKLGY